MTIQLNKLATEVGATLSEKSDNIPIEGVATLSSATNRQISFLSSQKYLEQAKNSKAAAIILSRDIPEITAAKLITDNPYLCWAKTAALFAPDRSEHLPDAYHASATIDPTAKIASNTHIGPNAFIGGNTRIGRYSSIHAGVVIEENCTIGDNVEIHPNAVIHYGTEIGNNCIIWSNAVIGSYGFGNAKDGAKFVPIHQLGHVILEDDVGIGACTTIDRGAIENTIIRRGTKIDNQVMIAHNVEIGEDTAIAAQTGISGSTKIGNQVLIAGQAGFVGHIEIGSQSFVGAKAGISKSFPPGSKITGYPARNLMDVRRSDMALTKLPALLKKVRELEKQIEDIAGK
ncbi:MAG: UDP-3-O-(3-hydroxymyristoyl)glucosamine N-acyltransferase [Methylococcales bacterium]